MDKKVPFPLLIMQIYKALLKQKSLSKSSNFLLVGTANLRDQLQNEQKLHGELLCPRAKLLITRIPIEMAGIHPQIFAEQWLMFEPSHKRSSTQASIVVVSSSLLGYTLF